VAEISPVVAPSKRALVVLATTTGAWISTMDQTVANTALPTIAHEVHASAAASIWVINAYQVALTMGIVPLAAAGDILGYRRVFLWALLGFVFASIACATSHTLLTLCAARFLQGLAGSAMTMSSAPIVRLAYPPAQLGRAVSYTALGVALGAAAGPPFAGVVLSVASWHWLFAVNVPVCLIAYVLATYAVPKVPGSGRSFDWIGAGLGCATFGLAVTGFDALGHGTATLQATLELVAAAGVGWLFVRRELALPVPMFPVDLFAEPRLRLAALAAFTAFIGQTIAYVALPFAFQTVMGRSPLAVGALMLPWLLASAAVAPFAGRLADRFNSSRLTVLGLGIFAAGLALMAFLPAGAGTFDIVWRMVVCGLGYAVFQTPNNRAIQGSAPRDRSGAGQAIQSVARLSGQTTGALVVAFVFSVYAANAAGSGANAAAIAVAMEIAVGCAAFAGAISLWRGWLTGAIRLRAAR